MTGFRPRFSKVLLFLACFSLTIDRLGSQNGKPGLNYRVSGEATTAQGRRSVELLVGWPRRGVVASA